MVREDEIMLSDLIPRRLYRLASRNLSYGVWDAAHRGFVGIREKGAARFPDMEFHIDTGPPYGTADAVEDMQIDLPSAIGLHTYEGPVCKHCGRRVRWLGRPDTPAPWAHMEPPADAGCTASPQSVVNAALFAWLDAQEQQQRKG